MWDGLWWLGRGSGKRVEGGGGGELRDVEAIEETVVVWEEVGL
jgi:hypothetical protein